MNHRLYAQSDDLFLEVLKLVAKNLNAFLDDGCGWEYS